MNSLYARPHVNTVLFNVSCCFGASVYRYTGTHLLEYTVRKSTFSCVCIFGSLSWGRDMGLYTPRGYIIIFCSYPEIFCLYFQEYKDLSILVSKCYRGRYLKMANIPLRGYLRKSMLFMDKFRFKKSMLFNV